MRLLLDTHIVLWAASGVLPLRAETLLLDESNILFFSSASIWEITIKMGLGKPGFYVDPAELRKGLLENQYQELPVTGLHALGIRGLPSIHKDPFDRLLLAQAQHEKLTLVTSDAILKKYPGSIIYVPK